MSDKELLELAAKAAGVEVVTPTMLEYGKWNPLTDDGDALRLAVKLNMTTEIDCRGMIWAYEDDRRMSDVIGVMCGDDPYAATRRAIVQAAAEIGRKIK